MPLHCDCPGSAVSDSEMESLWQAVRTARHYPDAEISLRCVDEVESRRLNKQYHHRDQPTNVLTFSYPPSPATPVPTHDVAVCLPLVTTEAQARRVPLRDYTAYILTHAFLHAAGMDHEPSAAALAMAEAERQILSQCGFAASVVV